MQLEISSSKIEIWEDMEEIYNVEGESLRQKRYRRRINFSVFPLEDNSLTFKTGEIFMNPNDKQWSEDSYENDEDDGWEGKPRMSCIMELYEDKDWNDVDTDLYFRYSFEDKDDLGYKTPSTLSLVCFNSDNIIQSMIENLRNNIKPNYINLDFEIQKHLKLGFGSSRFKQYTWNNTVSRILKIENLSVVYSV